MPNPVPACLLMTISVLLAGCAGSDAQPRVTRKQPAKVLLLGDSISIGYTPHVQSIMAGEAVVLRPTRVNGTRPENCEGSTKGIVAIDRWLMIDGGGFDVIHFNFGLHDLKRVDPTTGRNSNDAADPPQASLDKYIEQLRSIVDRLQSSGAILIFATTTPVPEGGVRPHRDPGDVIRYNDAAVLLMRERGIQVNDLHAFALPRLGSLQKPVDVHFTAEGSKALAGEVVTAIRVSATGD